MRIMPIKKVDGIAERPRKSAQLSNPQGIAHRRLRRTLASALCAASLCGGAALITTGVSATSAGAASETTTGFLSCDALEGGAVLSLPSPTPGALYSQFYFSVDGGALQASDWFLGLNYNDYDYAGGTWTQVGVAQDVNGTSAGTHTIAAWNLEYYNGAYNWFNLGSCTSSNLIGPGSDLGGNFNYIGL